MAASFILPPDVLIEERQDQLMISLSDGNPTQRSALFLNPTLHSLPSPPSPCSSSSKLITISDSKKTLLKTLFQSHRPPTDKWKAWVDRLLPLYQQIWNQAGIYHSILSSTQKIPKDRNLMLSLAERWCVESNTFIFPWAEATLTLEDMAVLGGFSVLGDSVLSPLKTMEALEIRNGLENAQREIKLNGTRGVSHHAWMDYFMDTGKKFEHQAFLVFWLSRFVLTKKGPYIVRDLFPVAIHLSYGTPIALAPAVLASIYRDLRLLKKIIDDLSKLGDNDCMDELLTTPLSSPFQLVLLWAWKRFSGDPRLGKRHGGKKWDVDNVSKALDSAEECFLWRPYALSLGNFVFSELYKETGEWVLVDSDSNIGKELESYARCLRVSELVGLDCTEQYLPNRVAMQFGFDQDIPGFVTRSNVSFLEAWNNYNRPITDVKIYVPPRLFEADVTLRYLKWYKGSSSTAMEYSFKGVNITKKKRSVKYRTIPRGSWGGQSDSPLLVIPASLAMCDREDDIDEDKMTNAELVRCKRKSSTPAEEMCVDIELSNCNRETDSSETDQEKKASDDVCSLSLAEATVHDTLKDRYHDALAVPGVENSDKENYGGNLICSEMLSIQDDYIAAKKVKVSHSESSDVAQLEYGNHNNPLVELPMNLHATPMNLPQACELGHIPEVVLQNDDILEISPSDGLAKPIRHNMDNMETGLKETMVSCRLSTEPETNFPGTPRYPKEEVKEKSSANIFATGVEGANSVRSSNCDETIALTSPNSDGKSVEQAEGVLTKQGEGAPTEGVGFEPTIERGNEGVELVVRVSRLEGFFAALKVAKHEGRL